MQNTALSLVMIPLNGPGTPTVFNADVSVNPASTMKLVTTYAALEMLGPTTSGKPSSIPTAPSAVACCTATVPQGRRRPQAEHGKTLALMRDLRANGVQQVTGDLVLDRSFFNQPLLPEFNDDGNDENKPFLVKPDALLVNLKALRFVARNDSGKVLVSVEPPIASIRIDNQVKVSNAKQCTGDVRYNPVTAADGSVTVTVSGQWPMAAVRRPTCRCWTTHLHRWRRARDLEGTGRHHPGPGYPGASAQGCQGAGPGVLAGPG
ncbi:d-Ala-D-Ala carboxypeptidase 3 (S13) family domain-containing protein [Ditylenchus destructor]|nr:d-Ala-D-Ala carboxypeptidase 3 (S13) family domain-containing protein [Ditylenchus destructor]